MSKYALTALIGLSIGMAFMLIRNAWPEPEPPQIIYALYQFAWSDSAITARTSECGETDAGNFYFKAIDPPEGWAFISLNNLRFGLCLDEEVPESPLGVPSGPMAF